MALDRTAEDLPPLAIHAIAIARIAKSATPALRRRLIARRCACRRRARRRSASVARYGRGSSAGPNGSWLTVIEAFGL